MEAHMESITKPLTLAGNRSGTRAGSTRGHRMGSSVTTVAALFLGFDSLGKLLEVEPVVQGAAELGYPPGTVFILGVVLLLCLLVYLVPRTSVAGAILLTGYLGGAVATHVRVGSPILSHTLFPVYVAVFVWGGLVLRDPRARALLWPGSRLTGEIRAVQDPAMMRVTSRDGTAIACERSGAGPAVILVDGALCSRAFGPMPKLAPLLARYFTVFAYDRRGRGQSGDTQPYSTSREIEDIAALIEAAGGSASVVGLSSGGALALEAAAHGLDIAKVVAYEPPYVDDGSRPGHADHERRLGELLAAGDRGGAVTYFMRTMVGVPAPAVVIMRLMPWIWRKLAAVAHTLPYDAALMNGFTVPAARFASIKTPALVMHGSKTDARLQKAARAVADAVPGAFHRTLPGQTHNVKPAVLVPAIVEFLTAPGAPAGARR
jgi:pimeloyl-ACP methyl ester carboxylesterase